MISIVREMARTIKNNHPLKGGAWRLGGWTREDLENFIFLYGTKKMLRMADVVNDNLSKFQLDLNKFHKRRRIYCLLIFRGQDIK